MELIKDMLRDDVIEAIIPQGLTHQVTGVGSPRLQCTICGVYRRQGGWLGAILVQRRDLGDEKVLAFASCSLNPLERNYPVTELECLTVVWVVEKCRIDSLEGHLFTVVTDHASLLWVLTTTKPSTRLIRWALRLQDFTLIIEYRNVK